MITSVQKYFSEFKVLKKASKDFWLINAIQFLDGLAFFSMITVLTFYLTDNCGFSDIDSGAWVGIWSLYVTAFAFAVGSICDTIGIKKSFFIALSLVGAARGMLGLAPVYLSGDTLSYVVKTAIIIMALGSAFMGPVIKTAIRRFTSKETRATGFNFYYLLMNVAAIIAAAVIIDGFRRGFPSLGASLPGFISEGVVDFVSHGFGTIRGNLAILDFGLVMSILAFICVTRLDENNYAEESERVSPDAVPRRPLAIFMEVWKERTFQKLLLFLTLTIGVRLVFTHQFLVMPKYYTRVLYGDFELGLFNSINPLIIVVGLIVLIPVINRYSTIKLIIVGMVVSASSLIFLVVPIQWILEIPGINSLNEAYIFVVLSQILIFALGELIFSPRFMEYVASVAPSDRVSSYMVLAELPTFISKPINGFVSGILISRYCYDGIRPKIETGNVSYSESPETMWLLYLGLAVLSPIAVILFRKFVTCQASDDEEKSGEGKGVIAAGESGKNLPKKKGQIKVIIIDALILFSVSTCFVLMANWVFSGLKDKGVKDDPLVSVITQGKVEEFSSMVRSGDVDLTLVDGEGRTSLMRAAYVNFNELDRIQQLDPTRAAMVKVLLESGAPRDAQDKDGWTALMWGAWSGMPTVVDELLNRDADFKLSGDQGHRALTLAAMGGHTEIVQTLLDAGADPSVKTLTGLTALDLAQKGLAKDDDQKSHYEATIKLLEGK